MTSVTKEYLCIICTIFICTNGWCRFDCKYLFNHTGTNYIWKFEIYNLRRTCLYAKRINITVMVSLLHRQVLQNNLWNISCLILLHHKIELNLESVCLKPVQMGKKHRLSIYHQFDCLSVHLLVCVQPIAFLMHAHADWKGIIGTSA